ncbi:MAG: PQQ-binding-like beta-propeller repeat protein [Planctomycetota bacterium]
MSHADFVVYCGERTAVGLLGECGRTAWMWERDLPATEVFLDARRRKIWDADTRARKDARFLGVGVRSGSRIFTVVASRSLDLWCLSVSTGEVAWRASLDEVGPWKGPRGASVAVADGVAYCCTESGVVAAVRDGEVLWRQRFDSTKPGFAFNDPVIVGRRVVVAPRSGARVAAYDRTKGSVLWTWTPPAPPGRLAYIAGATQDTVVLAGSCVAALDLESGKPRWGPRRLPGTPYGRGFVGRRQVFVPTKGERATIERFDLETGASGKPLRFELSRLGNLLWMDGRLIVSNEDEVMCFTTLERERTRPNSPLDQAIVAVRHGSAETAAAHFRELMDNSPQRWRARNIRSLALEEFLRRARKRKDEKALAQAGRFATAPQTKALVDIVAAELLGGAEREAALARLRAARVDVVLNDEVMRSDRAARMLDQN